MLVNHFRAPVIVMYLRTIKKSLRKPVDTDTIHITKYGNDDQMPLDLIENCKTSLMYFGKSETII